MARTPPVGLVVRQYLSARNPLIRRAVDRKNRRHARPFSVPVSIRPIALQRTSGRCHRERSTTNANSCVSTKTEVPAADSLGPGILDHSPQPVVRVATSADLRPGRHRRPLASRAVPQILGPAFQAAAPASRSPRHRRRTPPVDRANGRRQSLMARTQVHASALCGESILDINHDYAGSRKLEFR